MLNREEIDQAHALSASLADVQKQGHVSVIDRQLAQHPMMKSDSAAVSAETSSKYNSRPEDFPTLDTMQQSTADDTVQPTPGTTKNSSAVESAPQAGRMSLAKKLAMASRLSVRNGQMDLADFPSLSNSRPTATRKGTTLSEDEFPSLSSSSKFSRTAPSVWNAKDQEQSFSHARKAEDLQSKNSDEDFPSLTRMAPTVDRKSSVSVISRSCNSLADVSRNLSSGSLSKMVDQTELSWGPEVSCKSDDPKGNETEEHDNFLRLNTNKKSSISAVREVWVGNSGMKQVSASSNVLNKSSVVSAKLPVKPAEAVTVEHGKDRGGGFADDSLDWTHVGNEKKAQSKPLKSNDAKQRAENTSGQRGESKKVAKSKAKSDETTSQVKNGKDRPRKKQTTSKMEKETAAAKTSSKDVAKPASEADTVDEKSGNEKDGGSALSKPDLAETLVADVPSGNGDSVAESEKQRVDASSAEGCESVPNVDSNTRAESDVPLSSDVLDVAAVVPVFSAEDFPSLSIQPCAPSSLPSLPPGFSSAPVVSTKPPPPPGFSNPVPVVSRCPPPGLNDILASAVVVDSNSQNKAIEVDAEVSVSVYIPPRDMQQRSAALVGFISSAVKDGSFAKFRDLSDKFRAGNVSAADYHSGCYDIMDSTAFTSIFPELIALLPDLPKQHHLLKVHREFLSKTSLTGKTRSWSTIPEDGLVSCVVCSQILRNSDNQDHALEHDTFNTDYPTLPSTSLCSVR